MQITIKITGRTPLVMHNVRLADKEDEFAKQIAVLTAKKRNRTEADTAQIEQLEFLGGLYHDPEIGIYVPTWNVVRSFENAGKITRRGTDIIRALAVSTDRVPLLYDGPKSPTKLLERPEFRWRTSVGMQRKKITRVRPIFRQWGLVLEAEMLEDVIDLDDLQRIGEKAGLAEGLCDARKLGYGRFSVEIVPAERIK